MLSKVASKLKHEEHAAVPTTPTASSPTAVPAAVDDGDTKEDEKTFQEIAKTAVEIPEDRPGLDNEFDDIEDEKGKRDGRTEAEWALVEEKTKTDRNFLLPSEIAALATLKSRMDCSMFHDRMLYVCLFARKLDVSRTVELLHGHIKWKKAHGFDRPRRLSDVDQKLVDSAYSFATPNVRDSKGRGVMYIFMNRFFPDEYAPDAFFQNVVWSFEWTCHNIDLDIHRKGFTVIETIHGVSLRKNFAFGKTKAAMDKFMKEGFKYFPMRIASILVIEPGKILEVLLKIAKFFVKKKLLARVETLSKLELQSRVAPEDLLPEFGGTSTFDYAQLIAQIRAQEEGGHSTQDAAQAPAQPAQPTTTPSQAAVPPPIHTTPPSTPKVSPVESTPPSSPQTSSPPVTPSASLLPHAQ